MSIKNINLYKLLMIIIIIGFRLLKSIRWIHQLKIVLNVVEYFKWKQNGVYNLYLSKKKKESDNSRLYMLYIYEIIFPKDVRELPVNEIYKEMIHGISLYDKFRLSLLSRKFFFAPNPFCKCHATTFLKENIFLPWKFKFVSNEKNIYSVTYSVSKNLVMFLPHYGGFFDGPLMYKHSLYLMCINIYYTIICKES